MQDIHFPLSRGKLTQGEIRGKIREFQKFIHNFPGGQNDGQPVTPSPLEKLLLQFPVAAAEFRGSCQGNPLLLRQGRQQRLLDLRKQNVASVSQQFLPGVNGK